MLILGKEIEKIEENKNVHLIGVVINKRDYEKYKDLIVDDFSNIIVLRSFDLDLNNFEIGDFVFVYGYVKEYQEKKRIYIKNIRKIDELSFFYWKIRQFLENNYFFDLKELEKSAKKSEKEEEKKEDIKEEIEVDIPIEIEEIEIEDFDPKKYLMEIIEKSPNKEISIDELYKKANKLSKEEVDKLLEELSDELFEPRPGIIKKIEI